MSGYHSQDACYFKMLHVFDILLDDWQKHTNNEYVRNRKDKLFAPVSIVRIYSRNYQGFAWYPVFNDQLEFIQKIYDESTNYKEFHWACPEEGMKFVDHFLLRLHNLKAFI